MTKIFVSDAATILFLRGGIRLLLHKINKSNQQMQMPESIIIQMPGNKF